MYRKIFCSCTCGEVFRLSDAQIVIIDRAVPSDWLSKLQLTSEKLESQINRADNKFIVAREKVKLREQRRAHKSTLKAVETIIPKFGSLKINTNDVKSIFSPIHFVAFDGLYNGDLKRICFLDTEANSKAQENIQLSISKSIQRGNLAWTTLRVTEDGAVTKK
jgi:predicted Holliday junction resolvase-like endonuclease